MRNSTGTTKGVESQFSMLENAAAGPGVERLDVRKLDTGGTDMELLDSLLDPHDRHEGYA